MRICTALCRTHTQRSSCSAYSQDTSPNRNTAQANTHATPISTPHTPNVQKQNSKNTSRKKGKETSNLSGLHCTLAPFLQ
jgi:hypothetical protein